MDRADRTMTRRRRRAATGFAVLLAFFAFAPAGSAGHYEGQDCSGCHKFRGGPGAKGRAMSTAEPQRGASTGPGASTGRTGAAPARPSTGTLPYPGATGAR